MHAQTHPWSDMEKLNVPSYRSAESHQDALISLFSSGLLIPLLPYAAYMDYHMLLNSVGIWHEVITLILCREGCGGGCYVLISCVPVKVF